MNSYLNIADLDKYKEFHLDLTNAYGLKFLLRFDCFTTFLVGWVGVLDGIKLRLKLSLAIFCKAEYVQRLAALGNVKLCISRLCMYKYVVFFCIYMYACVKPRTIYLLC